MTNRKSPSWMLLVEGTTTTGAWSETLEEWVDWAGMDVLDHVVGGVEVVTAVRRWLFSVNVDIVRECRSSQMWINKSVEGRAVVSK